MLQHALEESRRDMPSPPPAQDNEMIRQALEASIRDMEQPASDSPSSHRPPPPTLFRAFQCGDSLDSVDTLPDSQPESGDSTVPPPPDSQRESGDTDSTVLPPDSSQSVDAFDVLLDTDENRSRWVGTGGCSKVGRLIEQFSRAGSEGEAKRERHVSSDAVKKASCDNCAKSRDVFKYQACKSCGKRSDEPPSKKARLEQVDGVWDADSDGDGCDCKCQPLPQVDGTLDPQNKSNTKPQQQHRMKKMRDGFKGLFKRRHKSADAEESPMPLSENITNRPPSPPPISTDEDEDPLPTRKFMVTAAASSSDTDHEIRRKMKPDKTYSKGGRSRTTSHSHQAGVSWTSIASKSREGEGDGKKQQQKVESLSDGEDSDVMVILQDDTSSVIGRDETSSVIGRDETSVDSAKWLSKEKMRHASGIVLIYTCTFYSYEHFTYS